MKTPDEIKEGLYCCYIHSDERKCGECPYIIDDVNDCDCTPGKDAYDYIKQLEHYISEISENVAQLEEAHVVRCRDCDFWMGTQDYLQGKCLLTGEYPTGAWYCANGKIKEAESDA